MGGGEQTFLDGNKTFTGDVSMMAIGTTWGAHWATRWQSWHDGQRTYKKIY